MTTTDTHATIREFLSLPPEALPAAQYLSPWNEDAGVPAGSQLRDYVLPEHRQRINHMGEQVRLVADRDHWRNGVIVALS